VRAAARPRWTQHAPNQSPPPPAHSCCGGNVMMGAAIGGISPLQGCSTHAIRHASPVHKHVLRLQVTVPHASSVQVLQAPQQLVREVPAEANPAWQCAFVKSTPRDTSLDVAVRQRLRGLDDVGKVRVHLTGGGGGGRMLVAQSSDGSPTARLTRSVTM